MTEPATQLNSEESDDSDLEDGDTVLTRGWQRNPKSLVKHGFRPVWTSEAGYPDPLIPSDIMEYLNEDRTCRGACFVGPLRSLAWLVGLDELVEAVDSPAFTITDGIEVVPSGADLMWAVEGHTRKDLFPSALPTESSKTDPVPIL